MDWYCKEHSVDGLDAWWFLRPQGYVGASVGMRKAPLCKRCGASVQVTLTPIPVRPTHQTYTPHPLGAPTMKTLECTNTTHHHYDDGVYLFCVTMGTIWMKPRGYAGAAK